jgi:RNA polymerase-binding transcription factor DksA
MGLLIDKQTKPKHQVLTAEKLDDTGASSNPQLEEELKENIRKEISNIAAENLQKVNQNLFRRCKECLHVERQHFQQLL